MKVGDYVRTKYGIAKVISSKVKDEDDNNVLQVDKMLEPYFCDGCDRFLCDPKDVIKSSTNIMDLIKKKDVLVDYKDNMYQVVRVWMGYAFTDKENAYGQIITLVDYQIKSIVTKEQFESMQYNLESEVN
ncbi:MAG: hypothetical protein ACI4VE_05725 [Clostridia bacterium]